jgi:hypothetical protein
MTDTSPKPGETVIPLIGGLNVEASNAAPLIFVESVPCFGFNNGVFGATLEIQRQFSGPEGMHTDRVVVAHLRMTTQAAQQLVSAFQQCMLAMQRPEGRAN